MKITNIQIVRKEKIIRENYPYVKPTDYYTKYIGEKSPFKAAFMDEICFLKMNTSEGIYSIIETSSQVCDFIISNLSNLVINFSPSDINLVWDLLYRFTLPIGRAGLALHAISIINLMMYDIYAKSLGVPVYDLLGGKTREKIKAYASHLHPADKESLQREALEYVNEGYTAMKMRFCCGPSDPLGVDKNVELVKVIRDAIGYNVELAGDAWMSWNYNFALKVIRRLEKYEMSWIEEPLLPDDFEGYKELTKKVETPISAGEHHYHVYDFKRLLDSGVRILQPDAVWVGGITPMIKIAGLAEAYGAIVIPHTSNIYNLHFIVSQPEAICPMAEYLTKYRWLEDRVTNPPKPVKGYFMLEKNAGFGLKYDFE